MKRAFLTFFAVAVLAFAANAQGINIGDTMENFTLQGIDGKTHSLNDLKGKNGAVVMFLSAQCPVVKDYIERINKIAAEYEAKGIKFIGINSNHTESLEWVTSDAKENFPGFPMLIDKGNKLADKLGATVTPEAYFVDADNKLLYHGAIDNDRKGKNIQEQYLRAAFDSKLGGKAIERTRANAFGCTIKRVEAEK
jgi:peroxiredoxin